MHFEDEENTFWDDEDKADGTEAGLSEQARRQAAEEQRFVEEMEDDAKEHPIEDNDSEEEPSERELLKRELRAQAIARLEDAARSEEDFESEIPAVLCVLQQYSSKKSQRYASRQTAISARCGQRCSKR